MKKKYVLVISVVLLLLFVLVINGVILYQIFNSKGAKEIRIQETPLVNETKWQGGEYNISAPQEGGMKPPINNTEQNFEEQKQRMIALIDRIIDRLQEEGDSENVTKLTQIREKVEQAKSLDELREVLGELREITMPGRPKESPQFPSAS